MRKQQLEVLTKEEAQELDEKIKKEFLAKKGELLSDIDWIHNKWMGIVKTSWTFKLGTFLNRFVKMPQGTYQNQLTRKSHMKKGVNYEKLKNFLER